MLVRKKSPKLRSTRPNDVLTLLFELIRVGNDEDFRDVIVQRVIQEHDKDLLKATDPHLKMTLLLYALDCLRKAKKSDRAPYDQIFLILITHDESEANISGALKYVESNDFGDEDYKGDIIARIKVYLSLQMKPDIELTPEPQPILANNPSVFFANNRPMPFPSESEIKVLSEGHAFNEEGLKIRLKKYIARIESYANNTETIAFGEDFCQWGILKMKDSRARNRDANYRLAKELLRELEDGHDVPEVFRDLEGKRDKYKQLTNHTLGIHSSELKSIIKDANNMIRKRATLR